MTDATWVAMIGLAVALVAAVPATIAAFASLSSRRAASDAKAVAVETTEKINTLSINVDGRLTKLMEVVEQAALLRGREEGAAGVRTEQAAAMDAARAAELATATGELAGATTKLADATQAGADAVKTAADHITATTPPPADAHDE